jgi:NAD(P)-dependent dehydrogenase (short-subunit alcohol dehydrogenase family)
MRAVLTIETTEGETVSTQVGNSARVAIVTGGGGGIGAATSHKLASDGCIVVVAEIDRDRAAATAASISSRGGTADAFVVDVTDPIAIRALRDHVETRHGGVDVLVNNVGHYLQPTPFTRSTSEHWSALASINLDHVFAVTHACLPSMLARRRARGDGGAIVNVSSVEGMRGYPVDPVYGAYKAAVIHFTRCLALELGGRGIRVNAVGPDLTQSLQVDYSGIPEELQDRWPTWAPVGRVGTPEDQADVIAFLASDAARFVTGHCIPTDGGSLAGGGWFRVPGTGRWTNRPMNP